MYLPLKAASSGTSIEVIALQAIRSSNELYGNGFASANALQTGYNRPIVHGSLVKIPTDIIGAHDKLISRRKMNAIFRTNAVKEALIHVGDLNEVFVKRGSQKQGSWSQPTPVLKCDPEFRTVTIASSKGRLMDAARMPSQPQ